MMRACRLLCLPILAVLVLYISNAEEVLAQNKLEGRIRMMTPAFGAYVETTGVVEVQGFLQNMTSKFELVTPKLAYELHTFAETKYVGFEEGESVDSWVFNVNPQDRYRVMGSVAGNVFNPIFRAMRIEYLGNK